VAHQKAEFAKWYLNKNGFVLTADREAETATKEAMLMTHSMSPSEIQTAKDFYREFKEKWRFAKLGGQRGKG